MDRDDRQPSWLKLYVGGVIALTAFGLAAILLLALLVIRTNVAALKMIACLCHISRDAPGNLESTSCVCTSVRSAGLPVALSSGSKVPANTVVIEDDDEPSTSSSDVATGSTALTEVQNTMITERYKRLTTRNGPLCPCMAACDSDVEHAVEFYPPVNSVLQHDDTKLEGPAGLQASVPPVHTQVEYTHFLVPDLHAITQACYYFGVMNRFEAEKLLENKPEGTFLLRDSAQSEYLFSVSFRRYQRTLHARIEQLNHRFSFDAYDPSVFCAKTVTELIEHYKDPANCLFFEPQLSRPLCRDFVFPLQHLCRAVICSRIAYNDIAQFRIPKSFRNFLREYHYRQPVRVVRME